MQCELESPENFESCVLLKEHEQLAAQNVALKSTNTKLKAMKLARANLASAQSHEDAVALDEAQAEHEKLLAEAAALKEMNELLKAKAQLLEANSKLSKPAAKMTEREALEAENRALKAEAAKLQEKFDQQHLSPQ